MSVRKDSGRNKSNKVKVLFIYSLYNKTITFRPIASQELIPLGVGYLSSLLKQHGHKTKALVLNRTLGEENSKIVAAYLKRFYPSVICFTAISSEYNFIVSIAQFIKSHYKDIYVVIGGVHVTLAPEEVPWRYFDALCIGEGEQPLLELISQYKNGLSLSGIPNLWIKHRSRIEKNPPRQFLQDLDSLPFPDRKIWDEWVEKEAKPRSAVLLGRGCPFTCTYCCNHKLKKLLPENM